MVLKIMYYIIYSGYLFLKCCRFESNPSYHRSTVKLIQEKSLEIKRFFVFQASSIDNEEFMVFTPLHTIWQNNSSLMLLCPPLALHSIIDIILRI